MTESVTESFNPSVSSCGRDSGGHSVGGSLLGVSWLWLACLAVLGMSCSVASGAGEGASGAGEGASVAGEGSGDRSAVSIGIGGQYRIGCWTMVRLARSVEAGSADAGSADAATADGELWVSLETVDGDGTRVIYRQRAEEARVGADGVRRRAAYCIPGGEAVPLVVRGEGLAAENESRAGEGEPWHRTRFPELASPHRGASLVPAEMPWVISMGDPLGVETVGANELLGRAAQVAVSTPGDSAELPGSVLGYDGVDLMLVHAGGAALLAGLDEAQASAMVDWVRGGGRMLIALGESAPELLEAAPWLYRLLPLEAGELEMARFDPAGFETYMSSQTQLSSFTGPVLPPGGRQLISGRTTQRLPASLASEYIVGLGRLTVVANDLHRPPMADWPERLEMIERLTDGALHRPEETAAVARRVTGFDDLAGQTREMLDQFELNRPFRFSVITLIVLGVVALIGPLDYWFINRILKRPAFGWMTFPAVTLAISIWLAIQAQPRDVARVADGTGVAATEVQTRVVDMELNRLEIIDIDSVDRQGRGFAWSYLYSHPARRVDLSVRAGEGLEAISAEMDHLVTAPFGWPGSTFGGIQLAGEDTRLPAYLVEMDSSPSAAAIDGLPLAPRGSKSLATQYRFRAGLSSEVVVSRRRGSELLEGSLVNPLPFDLLDGMLVYRDWAYLLPTRFPAGGRIDSLSDLRQKNFRWYLSRQRAIEQSTEGQAWDPSDDDGGRIAEMLMFHGAAGGRRYTGLRHVPLRFLDLSPLLTEERCMLVGRLAEPLTEMAVKPSAGPEGDVGAVGLSPPGDRTTMIRLVLPVEFAAPAR